MTTRILLFAFALTQVGCAFDMTELDDADLAGADEDLLLAIPIDAARVTFYSETGQWGTRLTASAPVLGPDESRRLVTTTEIEGAGLGRRISSVRLSCGSRAASLTLFVHPNRGTDFGGFGAGTDRSYLVACAANQVVDVDLHRDAPQYADRVAAAHLVNMPNPYENVPFTYVLSALWEAELATVDGAEPLGPRSFGCSRFTPSRSSRTSRSITGAAARATATSGCT